MDHGEVAEYDNPQALLENPKSRFFNLVNGETNSTSSWLLQIIGLITSNNWTSWCLSDFILIRRVPLRFIFFPPYLFYHLFY